MKYIIAFFSSTRTMAVLLILFALSIAVATFIENDYGTASARSLIYNAKWFEILLILGVINIIGVTIKRRLYRKDKLTLFVFHMGFIVVIIGAGITRYFGSEGIMHIKEGQYTSQWLTTQNHIGVQLKKNDNSISYSYPVLFSNLSANRFHRNYSFDGHKVHIRLNKFYSEADKVLMPDSEGIPYVHLITSDNKQQENFLIALGEKAQMSGLSIKFAAIEEPITDNSIVIHSSDSGSLSLVAPFEITCTNMTDQSVEIFPAGKLHAFQPMMIYNLPNITIVLKQYLPKASITAVAVDSRGLQLPSALIMDVTCDGIKKAIVLWDPKEGIGRNASVQINKLSILMNYGPELKNLPFGLRLNDFIFKRYPGSESPSWYESYVQLIDKEKKIDNSFRIYMNHILKYRGYRFYQSSYDADEKGTVLSLNRDWMGTTVTYMGYVMLALGMAMSLLNRKSRFSTLSKKSSRSKNITAIMVTGLLFISSVSFAQENTNTSKNSLPIIEKIHAQKFGRLLLQDNSGRIEPINTLASKVLRKIARKDNYKGQSPDQVILGMLVFPEIWQHEPMIRVGHTGIQKILGISSKYASFIDFFSKDNAMRYILHQSVEDAYRKKPAYRSKFDNEIMRTDERLNICYLIYTREVLKVFPDPNDSTNKWHSPLTATGIFKSEDSVFTNHILDYYFEETISSIGDGDWKIPEELIQSIDAFQKKYGAKVLPSEFHTKAEMFYNQSNIFARLTNIYLLVGILLLLIQFIHIFLSRFNIMFYSVPATIIVAITFLLHTSGLALRWYISGHAPWSNGYEALLFIAWATILAGLIFSRKSGITISATAVLAALILQTANLSWMDPQVTNLVPVLKSYWLVVHVAVITASYGFLGLGALLAAINLLLMSFETKKNHERLEIQINQISRIIEMTLIAGLYLLTIGTFLGGVWANESWGRYWAWDPKETWALITVIVYAFVIHIRIIPALKGRLFINIMSLISFATVLMTYFGVNYYLSGLHSYAKGDPIAVPPIAYYSVTSVLLLSTLAIINQLRLKNTIAIITYEEENH